MTVVLTCNACGGTIEDGDAFAQVSTIVDSNGGDRGGWRGWVAHYHLDGCYPRLMETVLDLQRAAKGEQSPQRRVDEYAERKAAWDRVTVLERERETLDVIGDGRLTKREVRDALRERFPGMPIYESDMRQILNRLLDAGELDRERERFKNGDSPGCFRWRYFRNTRLAGPIADLDRALRDSEAA